MPLMLDSVLEGLVKSHINWLTIRSISTRDVFVLLHQVFESLSLCPSACDSNENQGTELVVILRELFGSVDLKPAQPITV